MPRQFRRVGANYHVDKMAHNFFFFLFPKNILIIFIFDKNIYIYILYHYNSSIRQIDTKTEHAIGETTRKSRECEAEEQFLGILILNNPDIFIFIFNKCK